LHCATPRTRHSFSDAMPVVSPSPMPVPESTSAEALAAYVDGKPLFLSRGGAWREIKAASFLHTATRGTVRMPAISEPLLHWVVSGAMQMEEREEGRPWLESRIRAGSFFLTAAGAAYDCRWRRLTPEPFEFMLVSLALPLLRRALGEVFGGDAARMRLRELSGFEDAALHALMLRLRDELHRRHKASALAVQGLAQVIAAHLARHYAEPDAPAPASPSLPGHKLRRITGWMSANLAGELHLDGLAARAGLSKFYFHRLFRAATGVPPRRYQLNLRLETARRLLRETKKSVVEIALEVGYANPSHFAQLFRRETGLSPSDYRRQR
jgi:AraC family transcriptional regulator